MKLLDGIIVLDFAQYLAGLWAATKLADIGARVLETWEDVLHLAVNFNFSYCLIIVLGRIKLDCTLEDLHPVFAEGHPVIIQTRYSVS